MRGIVLLLIGALASLALIQPPIVFAKPKAKKEQGWEAIGLSGGGAMFCPAVSPLDPKLMMINCDMSCVFLSKDGGHNWKMIHYSQLGGNTRCKPGFHPTDAKVIFAAGGWEGRLKVTRDAGDTWTDFGNLPEGLRGEIAIDPERPEFMLTGSGDRVFLSTDGGKQWNACKGPSGEATGFAFGKIGKSPRWMWAATKQGLWRSDDDGRTWNEKCSGLPSREIRSLSGGFDAKGKVAQLYCAVPGTSDGGKYAGGVFASKDGGEKWESAMGEGINAETKAADSWAESEIAQYMHVATSNAKPLTVWAFNTNTGLFPPHHCGAYKSEDGGKTWKATFYPDPRMGSPYNVEPDYTTVGDGQYYQTVPNGVAICASNPDIALFVDGGNALVTDNGGKSWFNGHTRQAKEKGFFENTGLVVTSAHNFYVDPHEHKRHYICYTDIGFARSLDAGATWHWWSKDEKAPWRNTCYELAFDPDTPGKIWGAFSNVHDIPNNNIIGGRHKATGPGGVCVSTNFGETWTPVKGLPEAPCTSVALEVTKKGRALYAGFFGKGVWPQPWQGYPSKIACGWQGMGMGSFESEYISPDYVPTILACGENDRDVITKEAYPRFLNRLEELDVNYIPLFMQGLGHSLSYGYDKRLGVDRYQLVMDFFDRYLKVEDKLTPSMLLITPCDSAENISPSCMISVYFAPVIDELTILDNRGIRLVGLSDNMEVKGNWTVSHGGTKFTFTPAQVLRNSEQYKIIISTNVRDKAGIPLDKEKTVYFKVASKQFSTHL